MVWEGEACAAAGMEQRGGVAGENSPLRKGAEDAVFCGWSVGRMAFRLLPGRVDGRMYQLGYEE